MQGKCPQCGTPLAPDALGGLCPACLLKQGVVEDTVTEGKQPAFVPPTVAELEPLFPQLEILELIGKGGMGAVYKARQKQLDRIVALKILPPGIGDDPAFAARFAREAKALAKLNHPGIVTLYEFGTASGYQPSTLNHQLFYFLMEFVDGVNLRQLLHAGRISPHEALAIVPQICDALQYAHDLGIVHRDIKPENILLDRRGRVKVADFGLAKIVESNAPLTPSLSPSDGERVAQPGEGTSALTDAGKVMGTPQYMSPEQIQSPSEVDHRADIYALGVVFYQMLTGELPGKKIEPPSKKVSIDVRLDEVVLRALEQKPELRYQQASVLKTQVETIASTPGSSRGNEAQTPQNPSNQSLLTSAATNESRFSRTAIIGTVIGLLALVLFALAAIVAEVATHVPMPDGTVMRNKPADLISLLLLTGGGLGVLIFTLLGWIAVSQIRRSAGKLHGLGLAVFDGLLFPLLLLDAFIGWAMVMLVLGGISMVFHLKGTPSTFLILLVALPPVVMLDRFIIRRVWRAVQPAPDDSAASGEHPAPRGRKLVWVGVVAAVVLLLALIVLPNLISRGTRTNDTSEQIAESPFELRKLPTDRVIEAGLAKPNTPWAWQELEKRQLTSAEVTRIVDGLETWMKQTFPDGSQPPLHWVDTFLEKLGNRRLLNDEQRVRLAMAVHGNPRVDPLARLREGDRRLNVSGECRYIWGQDFLGLVMMNASLSASVDGQPVKLQSDFDHNWNAQHFGNSLLLPELAAGRHTFKLEVLSALVAKDDLVGLSPQTPPAEWPPAKKRWTRSTELEFTVYPSNAVLVAQTEDPALDPVANGSLGIKPALVRSKGDQAQAVLNFNFGDTLPVPISFDVSLRAGDQVIPCGTLLAVTTARSSTYSGRELTAELDRLAPETRTADVVLTPNPKRVEEYSSVDRIWGREVLFHQVRLIRQDLGEVAPPPVVAGSAAQGAGVQVGTAGPAPVFEVHPGPTAAWGKLLSLAVLVVLLCVAVALVIGVVVLVVRRQKRGGTGNGFAIGCAALLGGGILFLLLLVVGGLFWFKATKVRTMQHAAEVRRAEMESIKLAKQADRASIDTSSSLRFGPVIDRTLADQQRRTDCAIDLDTGTVFTTPASVAVGTDWTEQERWLDETGVDLMAGFEDGNPCVNGYQMAWTWIDDDLWEQLPDANTLRIVSSTKPDVEFRTGTDRNGQNRFLKYPSKATVSTVTRRQSFAAGEPLLTMAFKTREGGIGILQITSFTEDPRSVKLRYKLVQGAGPGASTRK